MADTKKQPTPTKDFRGLTVFEIIVILAVIGGAIFWALSTKSTMQNKVYDEQRKGRVAALKENLMTLVNINGSFPSDEEFQNDEIRVKLFATFLTDYGKDSLSDPQDNKTLITYIAEPEGCSQEAEIPCTKVAVSLKLSNNEEFIKFGIQPGKELEYFNEALQEDDGQTTEELIDEVDGAQLE